MSAYDLTRVATKRREGKGGRDEARIARLTSALEEAKKGLEEIQANGTIMCEDHRIARDTLNRIKELTEEGK